jgi:hypothetical protein
VFVEDRKRPDAMATTTLDDTTPADLLIFATLRATTGDGVVGGGSSGTPPHFWTLSLNAFHVGKHHYAHALQLHGRQVSCLEPPPLSQVTDLCCVFILFIVSSRGSCQVDDIVLAESHRGDQLTGILRSAFN